MTQQVPQEEFFMFTLDTTTTANAERAQEQSSFTSLSSAGAAAVQHLLVSPPGQISFHPRSPRCSPLTLSPGVVVVGGVGPAACNASPRIAAIAARGRLSLVAVVVVQWLLLLLLPPPPLLFPPAVRHCPPPIKLPFSIQEPRPLVLHCC